MLKFIYLSIISRGSCEYAVSIATIKFYSECINMLEAKLMQFQTKLKVYYSSITYITCEIVKRRMMKSSIHWIEAFLIFWPNRISKKIKITKNISEVRHFSRLHPENILDTTREKEPAPTTVVTVMSDMQEPGCFWE